MLVSGMEDIVVILQKILKDNLTPESFSLDKILNALQEVAKEFQQETSNSQIEYKFDESIIKNIKKLEEMYRKYNPKSVPFFNAFLDIFGTLYFRYKNFSTFFTIFVLLK